MIEAIFFDIDGTLVDSDSGTIPKSTLFSLTELKRKGFRLFVASGRPLCNISPEVLKAVRWDGYICSNGAAFHNADYHLLRSHAFSTKQKEQLFSLCEEKKITLVYQTPEEMFCVLKYDDDLENAFSFFHMPVPLYRKYSSEEVNMATVYQKEDFDFTVLNSISSLSTVKGKAPYADVMLSAFNKGTAINECRVLFDISQDCLAFGDGDNDLEMIESADISVAMGNATEKLKKKATLCTEGVDSDGIYKALVKLSLI